MRYLSEAEAWREIARRVAEDEWSGAGLCYEIFGLEDEGCLSFRAAQGMYDRIDAQMDVVEVYHRSSPGTFDRSRRFSLGFPRGEKDTRVLAALFLALEAEDEAQSVERAA